MAQEFPKAEIVYFKDELSAYTAVSQGKINAFLRAIWSDGTMDDIARRWLVMRDETMPEIPPTEASGLHLVVGTTGISMPFSYYIGTELAYRFAAWLGAGLEFKVYD